MVSPTTSSTLINSSASSIPTSLTAKPTALPLDIKPVSEVKEVSIFEKQRRQAQSILKTIKDIVLDEQMTLRQWLSNVSQVQMKKIYDVADQMKLNNETPSQTHYFRMATLLLTCDKMDQNYSKKYLENILPFMKLIRTLSKFQDAQSKEAWTQFSILSQFNSLFDEKLETILNDTSRTESLAQSIRKKQVNNAIAKPITTYYYHFYNVISSMQHFINECYGNWISKGKKQLKKSNYVEKFHVKRKDKLIKLLEICQNHHQSTERYFLQSFIDETGIDISIQLNQFNRFLTLISQAFLTIQSVMRQDVPNDKNFNEEVFNIPFKYLDWILTVCTRAKRDVRIFRKTYEENRDIRDAPTQSEFSKAIEDLKKILEEYESKKKEEDVQPKIVILPISATSHPLIVAFAKSDDVKKMTLDVIEEMLSVGRLFTCSEGLKQSIATEKPFIQIFIHQTYLSVEDHLFLGGCALKTFVSDLFDKKIDQLPVAYAALIMDLHMVMEGSFAIKFAQQKKQIPGTHNLVTFAKLCKFWNDLQTDLQIHLFDLSHALLWERYPVSKLRQLHERTPKAYVPKGLSWLQFTHTLLEENTKVVDLNKKIIDLTRFVIHSYYRSLLFYLDQFTALAKDSSKLQELRDLAEVFKPLGIMEAKILGYVMTAEWKEMVAVKTQLPQQIASSISQTVKQIDTLTKPYFDAQTNRGNILGACLQDTKIHILLLGTAYNVSLNKMSPHLFPHFARLTMRLQWIFEQNYKIQYYMRTQVYLTLHRFSQLITFWRRTTDF